MKNTVLSLMVIAAVGVADRRFGCRFRCSAAAGSHDAVPRSDPGQDSAGRRAVRPHHRLQHDRVPELRQGAGRNVAGAEPDALQPRLRPGHHPADRADQVGRFHLQQTSTFTRSSSCSAAPRWSARATDLDVVDNGEDGFGRPRRVGHPARNNRAPDTEP